MTAAELTNVDEFWALEAGTIQLNHGSYGACPRSVLAEQRRWQELCEANPTRWYDVEYRPAIDIARAALAQFVGADPAGLVFVPNATTGVSTALRAIEPTLRHGDEILVTDHAYAACRNALDALAMRSGAVVVVATIPFPLTSPNQLIEPVLRLAGPRTAIALLDHITSPTAVVMPVAELVAALEPEVTVIVDGAHAPGMLPLAIGEIGASFYTGNCHKWLCAPKGAALLQVAEKWRERTEPLVISHGWRQQPPGRSRFVEMFDWPGTLDPTPWLCVPAALETIGGLHPDGWPGVMATNRGLAMRGRDIVAAMLGSEQLLPDSMVGSMTMVAMSGAAARASGPELTSFVRSRGIEASFREWPVLSVRLSAQQYNTESDYEVLGRALQQYPG